MTSPLFSSRAFILTLSAALAVTGCTKPKQTTAVSAAAGGAIGAGLGAIVGNQTGNAGSGIAIGAVAGAATGALIGNALQAQQEKLDSQKESIQRQDQAIRAQRSEIEELRRMQSDSGYSQQARAQSVNSYLVEEKRLQLQKRGPTPRGGETTSHYSPPSLSSRSSEPLARYDAKSSTRATTASAAAVTSTAAVTAPKKAPAQSHIAKGIQEKDLASAASTQVETQKAEAVPVKAEPIKETSKEPIKETTIAKAVPQAETAGGCAEGKEAREAAASASDNSDKLFHLRKALRLCPNSADTHYELGQAYLQMDRAADASYEFKQALSINPGYAAAKESLKELDQGKAHY